jgi:hypothetical protein
MENGDNIMATSEERLMILKMTQEGKISAEESARLLSSLGEKSSEQPVPELAPVEEIAPAAEIAPDAATKVKGWLRIRVTDTANNKPKVSVNLPLGLVSVGLRIGSHYAPELKNLDIAQYLDEIKANGGGKIVEVDDEEDGEHVEIYID